MSWTNQKFKILLSLVALIILTGAVFTWRGIFMVARPVVTIGGQAIRVEVVKTDEQMALGLGERDMLQGGRGMLFEYDNYVIPRYWMKGMRFPLDIIWIKDDVVAGFEINVPVATSTPLPMYQPKDFINKVLEVNAGFVEKNGLKIGDGVKIMN